MQEVNVCRLEIQFKDNEGYDNADSILYVSIFNNEETTTDVGSNEHRATWGCHWHDANDQFESQLECADLYAHLRGKMFYV